MKYFVGGIFASVAAGLVAAAILYYVLTPRLNWTAAATPSASERNLAQDVLRAWIRRNASSALNPLPADPDMLKSAQREYEEHCAVCHGLDGGGQDQLEANFYPPVAKLTGKVQRFTDGELYFIVAKGIRYTAMPSFEKTHSPQDIWRLVLWVRHLAHLTPEEKRVIAARIASQRTRHDRTMQLRTQS